MTENTTAPPNAKTTKHAASSFDMPDFGILKFEMPKFNLPNFDLPNMEMPEAFREIAEKGVAQARDTYAKAKAASEEAADLLQKNYTTVARGVTDYNLKLIEIARTNTRAAFDYARELLDVKSPSEFFELSTAQLCKQFNIASRQNKELCVLAQETATEAAESVKTGVSKAFNKAA